MLCLMFKLYFVKLHAFLIYKRLLRKLFIMSYCHVKPLCSVNVCRFSTGLGVTGGSALIHDFYSREVSNPVHLTVDTSFGSGEGTIKAYVSVN